MRFLLLGVAITLLAGCGQKGPLYLRDNPRQASSPRSRRRPSRYLIRAATNTEQN